MKEAEQHYDTTGRNGSHINKSSINTKFDHTLMSRPLEISHMDELLAAGCEQCGALGGKGRQADGGNKKAEYHQRCHPMLRRQLALDLHLKLQSAVC